MIQNTLTLLREEQNRGQEWLPAGDFGTVQVGNDSGLDQAFST